MKGRAGPKGAKGGAVAATKTTKPPALRLINLQSGQGRNGMLWLLAGIGCGAAALPLAAAVLPDERFDALYHYYNGGGLTVEGPSIKASKQLGNHTAIAANYYVDSITSASIDVVTSASKYREERTEHSVSATYLHNKSTLNLNVTHSEENDFVARSAHFSVSQDMFGDLTTLHMGYSRGWDDIYKTLKSGGSSGRDPDFAREADRQNFRLGLTQILTKDLVANLNYELVTDKGFLNNPYRSARFSDGSSLPEAYPNTHSSNAIALSANYHLPYRAALHGSYRYFNDTWGISANTFSLGYTHAYGDKWILGGSYRIYSQNRANFYQDLFDPAAPQNYMARDKELSTFSSRTIGLNASYSFMEQGWHGLDKGSLNLAIDHMRYDYDDFSDLRGDTPAPYGFSANVVRLYLSLWY